MSDIFQSKKLDFSFLFLFSLIFYSDFSSIFSWIYYPIPFPFLALFCLTPLWPCNTHTGNLAAVPDLCFSQQKEQPHE